MSVTRRLISGSASSWMRMMLILITQVVLVPVYLTYWTVAQFGIWVAIQALVNVLVVFDRGFTDYLGFEFMKAGKRQPAVIGRYLSSGVLTLGLLAVIELVLLVAAFSIFPFNLTNSLLDADLATGVIVGWSVIVQWLAWIIPNFCGLYFRALVPFGYYPRMGWWSVVTAVMSAAACLVAVMNGAGILEASLAMLASNMLLTAAQFFDIRKLVKQHDIFSQTAQFATGLNNFYRSVVLSFKYFFEGFRQQGIRLLLTPLLGLAGIATFSTMRTVSNVLLQGISSISSPVLPELMSFLNNRDQQKTNAAFSTIWLVIVVLLSPGALLLQSIAAPLFDLWTKGRLVFDPVLFALLSLSVLVYALTQPRLAILIGNNRLRAQITLAILSMVVLVLFCVLLIPFSGLAGAGWALVLAELSAAVAVRLMTDKWLASRSIVFPAKPANIALLSVVNAGLGMLSMSIFPAFHWWCLAIFLLIAVYIIRKFWLTLPPLLHSRLKTIFKRIPLTG